MFQPWRRPKLGRAFRRWASFLSPASGPIRPSTIRPTVRSAPRPYRDTIVWYASIISVAAALDVGVKQRRRNHWDAAIAEVEDALQISPEQAIALRASILGPQNAPVPQILSTTAENDIKPQTSHSSSSSSTLSNLANESTIVNDLFQTRSVHKTSSSNRSQISSGPERSSHSSPSMRSTSKSPTATWTPKKLTRVESSVAKLSYHLVKEAPQDSGKKQLAQDLHEDMNFELQRTRFLDANDHNNLSRPALPKYEQLDEASTDHHRHELCESIKNVFLEHSRRKLNDTTTMRYIARSLMMSPTPPDARVYSMLVSEFSHQKKHGAANAVITSMRESNFRHDATSVSAILGHYIRQHSYKPFHHFVRQIQGFEGGLMLVDSRHIEKTTEDSASLNVRVCNEKLIQKIPLTKQLAHQIIFGYLSFHQKDMALASLEEARQQGLSFDAHFHCTLLWSAYRERNWAEVDSQWDQIYAFLRDPFLETRVSRRQEQFALHYVLKAYWRQGNLKKHKDHLRFGHSRGWSTKALLQPKSSGPRGLGFSQPSLESRKRRLDQLERDIALIAQLIRLLATELLALLPSEASGATLRMIIEHSPPLYGLPAPIVTEPGAEETKKHSNDKESGQPVSAPRIRVVYSYKRTDPQPGQRDPKLLPVRCVVQDRRSKFTPPKETTDELPWQRSRRARVISPKQHKPSHQSNEYPHHRS